MSIVIKTVPPIAAELNHKFGFDPLFEDVPDQEFLSHKHKRFFKKTSKKLDKVLQATLE